MRALYVKIYLLAAGAARLTNAHTAFTNFFVNGLDQGDGTAVRMSNNNGQATFPISSVTSADMACGQSLCVLNFCISYAFSDNTLTSISIL